MSAPTPATPPNLLRDGTSVRVIGESAQITGCDHAIVYSVHGDEACVSPKPMPYESTVPVYLLPVADLVLDLDNATTRAHLAWWILDRAADPYFARMSNDELTATSEAIERAYRGQPMNDRHINILVNVARNLAGLEDE